MQTTGNKAMSFFCPIKQMNRHGLDSVKVDVKLTLFTPAKTINYPFVFDTGCEITTVSEDVATFLGLPGGGRQINVKGATGSKSGRLVDVHFQFPNTINGDPGLECKSTWVVISGMKGIALLGFQEVHKHYCIRTLEFDMYFILWSTLHGN